MLRLKTNYFWPAMHPCSVEFGRIEENIRLADDWAIVMGASHAEPMNRNNVLWPRENRGPWRYDTNRDAVFAYWEEWAQRRGPYEAVWSVGMRGIHDSGMAGSREIQERVRLLDAAIRDQRSLLARHVPAWWWTSSSSILAACARANSARPRPAIPCPAAHAVGGTTQEYRTNRICRRGFTPRYPRPSAWLLLRHRGVNPLLHVTKFPCRSTGPGISDS